jgi:hypothetical protein
MPSGLSSNPRTARRAGGLSLTGTTVARTAFCALTLKRKPKHGFAGAMTTLTMRLVRGDFIVTGPDIAPISLRAASMRARARPRLREGKERSATRAESAHEASYGGRKEPRHGSGAKLMLALHSQRGLPPNRQARPARTRLMHRRQAIGQTPIREVGFCVEQPTQNPRSWFLCRTADTKKAPPKRG